MSVKTLPSTCPFVPGSNNFYRGAKGGSTKYGICALKAIIGMDSKYAGVSSSIQELNILVGKALGCSYRLGQLNAVEYDAQEFARMSEAPFTICRNEKIRI
ncbi:hypothetical protein EVAR_101534_1 [Eumeta japonica]|uniref:Uncharacterized protein n=1 Tax=Eumeta variegata TaxID=151549 RepID=A0A4C1SH11_EUMVA|nr:hypothetical protein EVAR_101534_1 [Eumeta japonica]